MAGAAHFLEHLLFKSTPTRTAVDIAQAMDAVGGELNAFTAKEHTCYYAHVLDNDLELAVELVPTWCSTDAAPPTMSSWNVTSFSRRSRCATMTPRTHWRTCS
ncbi:insulinase family protein [Mycobacterium ulcerans str. Harvey]|uniref:Insulinase family protein n=1 Tax=Mycobacterium ulcerans str. Harvey TaxID=1299332 RepID=A0ABP3ABH4_MYCUL|nr:insulinase family protein [Mycobacterium ulcerans str. Harvey]